MFNFLSQHMHSIPSAIHFISAVNYFTENNKKLQIYYFFRSLRRMFEQFFVHLLANGFDR